ncbi:MAG TPA: VCBS repeat-containing protein, partial [Flavisolibacter sp.]|nr:VCBS repeat-containing protein [Flavisolibacter sp.]
IHDSEDIALADFDKDGDIDIVFVSEDDRVHEYYLNDGKGFFTDNSLKIPVLSTCNAVDAADFDHDGDIDLILGNDGQDFFLLNDGKGNFTDETQSRMPVDYTVTQDVQSADLDGDGDLDLVMGNENGNRMYLNDGKGRFTNNTEGRLPVANEETRKADLADIDGDGDIDIFFSNVDFGKQKDKSNRILINNGKGFFTDETSKRFKALNDMHTADIEFADMNGDNYPDMLIGNVFGGYIQVCINDGKGNFTEISDTAFTSRIRGEAISVQVADVNKDGKKDVYLGMFRSADMLLLGR